MRKKLLSMSILGVMVLMPSCVLANVQYAPAENYQYQTQYPLPVNSYQPQGYQNTSYNMNQLQGNVVMVPANTSFPATLMSPISSETAKIGDSVSMYLGSDFYYGKDLIPCRHQAWRQRRDPHFRRPRAGCCGPLQVPARRDQQGLRSREEDSLYRHAHALRYRSARLGCTDRVNSEFGMQNSELRMWFRIPLPELPYTQKWH